MLVRCPAVKQKIADMKRVRNAIREKEESFMEVLTKYGEIARAAAAMTTLLAVCKVLLGLLNCFLGYKLLKSGVSMRFFHRVDRGIFGSSPFYAGKFCCWMDFPGIGVVSGILAYEIYLGGGVCRGMAYDGSCVFWADSLCLR